MQLDASASGVRTPFLRRWRSAIVSTRPAWPLNAGVLALVAVVLGFFVSPILHGVETVGNLQLVIVPVPGGGWAAATRHGAPAVQEGLFVRELRGPGWTARSIEPAPTGPPDSNPMTLEPPAGLYSLWLARVDAGDRTTTMASVEGDAPPPKGWERGVLACLASREAAGLPTPGVGSVFSITTIDRPWVRAASMALAWVPALLLAAAGVLACVRTFRRVQYQEALDRIGRGLCPRCGYASAGLTPGALCPECGADPAAVRAEAEVALGRRLKGA